MPQTILDVSGFFQNSRQFYHVITNAEAEIVKANNFFSECCLASPTADFKTLISDEDLKKIYKSFKQLEKNDPGPISLTLKHINCEGKLLNICWEVMRLQIEGPTTYFQLLGIEEHQSKSVFEEMGKSLEEIRERFNAYKHSSTGLWKVEMQKPMPTKLPANEALEFLATHAIITDCNENTAAILGYSSATEILGRPLKDVMSLEDERTPSYMASFIDQNFHIDNVEIFQKGKNGQELHLLHNITGVIERGKIKRIWGTVQDITLLKTVEERLRESELFYRNLINDSLDGIFITNEDGLITFVSASAQKVLGYSPDELKQHRVYELVHPEDQPPAKAVFDKGLSEEILFDFVNLRLKHKDGNWRWCMVRVHSMMDNPNVAGVIIYFADNSSRKEAEDALIKNEQLLRNLIETLSVGVQITDPSGKMILFNPTALELLGLTEEDVMGKSAVAPYDIIHEDGSHFSVEEYPITITLREKVPVKNVVMGLMRKIHQDRIWLIVNSNPVLDDSGNLQLVISSYSDITAHRKLILQMNEQEIIRQKQLLQVTIDAQEKERREIGRELHDNISQHLTITRLHLEVAKEMARGPLSEAINLAHKSLLGIVNEIRKLSHSLVPPSINDIGLTASIQDLCDSFTSAGSYVIDFNYDGFTEEVVPANMRLTIYRIIQEQLNNIIRHAEASRIFISLQIVEDTIFLFIGDNGKGFDPKKVRKGLGFTNINNRAGIFGGHMHIDTEPGKGCVVEIEIPVLGQ